MALPRKHGIITFKVDQPLWQALEGITNRSEFIRSAILRALDNACPLCKGTGSLTPDQRRHWETFSKNHLVEQCDDCHAIHLVCVATTEGDLAVHRTQGGLPQTPSDARNE